MEPHQFFKTHHWWGKILGAFLGYLISGPTGTILGIIIGNLFDRGLTEQLSRPQWPYALAKRKNIQTIFFKATFSMMGAIAKADGRVSSAEIQMANYFMEEMQLSKSQIAAAKQYFTQGKQPSYQIWDDLSTIKTALCDNPALLKLYIDIQYRAAQADGLSLQKVQILNKMLIFFGFAPLNQQYRFYEDFSQNTQHKTKQQESPYPQTPLAHAYAIIGITANATKTETKRAYRRLIAKNHPDKLIAQGLPEEMIRIAKEKTQQIIKAYESICIAKGW